MIGPRKEFHVEFVEGDDETGANAQVKILNALAQTGWVFLGMTPVTAATPIHASGNRVPNHDNDLAVGAASRTAGTFLYFERTRMPSPETVLPSETAPGSKMNRAMRRRSKR